MKRYTLMILAVCSALTMLAQTARTFTLDLTADGQAKMVCFLPSWAFPEADTPCCRTPTRAHRPLGG